ncbi:MAG: aspartyl-tRNA(Asn)/glutamyl-tRNA(Gln) amidotransferase subunit A [Rhodoferax sp.]|jgi:aspartyl-tRNA(Asn)/glutamyl-tRNA(Gln) amidotransferase subunit A
MYPDLQTTRHLLRTGQTHASLEIERAITAAQSARCAHAFVQTSFAQARQTARAPDTASTPLAGLAVSVKDLFDVAGETTPAGSLILQNAKPALQDSVAVQRLRRAGAALMGRTHMVEFAFSGVGINPHFETPANAAATDLPRIPGGSSSGAAISVATGAAFIGLGSDTGGSIRIPAALNGIVGFKSTARRVPTTGAVPLSTTLDTVCALTRSVPDALLTHELLAQRRVTRSPAPLRAYRLGVATSLMLDGLDSTVNRAWQRTLETLRKAGACIEELKLAEIDELPHLQAQGGFVAAESYAWHRQLLTQHGDRYDPRVASRIQRGATMRACDYLQLQDERGRWISRMAQAMHGFDAFLSPTVPIVAPPIAALAPGEERDAVFFDINAQLLRNPSVVNMLDGCALSLPCHLPDELPVGLMVWAGALHDDTVLNIALRIEELLVKEKFEH